jgi:sulfide:quinone oxidoreductase
VDTILCRKGGIGHTGAVEREVFANLIPAQTDRLARLARRLAQPGLDPDDLLQDTLERGWRSCGALHDHDALGAWLRVIMVNRVRDEARRRARVSFTTLPEAAEPEDLDIEDPLALIAAAEQEDHLRSALSRLPHDEQLAVALVDGEGWRADEVAAVCGCSAAAIHKRVQRARRRLALHLATDAGQPVRPASAECQAARELASDYLDGRLSPERRAGLEVHLRGCDRCPPILRTLQGIAAALGAGRGPDLPAGRLRALHAQVSSTAAASLPLIAVIGAGPGGLAAARRLRERAAGRVEVVLVTPQPRAVHLADTTEVALGALAPEAAEVPIDLPGVRLLVGQAHLTAEHRLSVDGRPLHADAVIAAPGLSLDVDSVPRAERVIAAWDPPSARRAAETLAEAERICVIVTALPYRCPPAPFGLAMRLAARGRAVTVCTPEPAPLAGVGADATRLLVRECRAAGVRLAHSFVPDFDAGLAGCVRSTGGEEIRFDAALVIPEHRRSSALRDLSGEGPLLACAPDGRVGERLWVVGDARQAPLPRAAGVAITQGANAADAALAELGIAAAGRAALPTPACWLWTGTDRAARITLSYPGGLPPAAEPLVRIDGPSETLARQARKGRAGFAALAAG